MAFQDWLERTLRPHFKRNCKIGDRPFFDKNLLPATADLEAAYPEIRAEVEKVLQRYDELTPFQQISPDQIDLSDDDRWKMFFLKAAGIRFERNIQQMPKTMAIIDKHPIICSAYLSILGPRKTLPPHEGPWSGILRAHLGVIIPQEGKCHIRVDGKPYFWRNGEVVYFDDTYMHEAHNDTDELRVVLFMDTMRPLAFPWNFINWAILRLAWLMPYVSVPLKRHKEWEKAFYGIGADSDDRPSTPLLFSRWMQDWRNTDGASVNDGGVHRRQERNLYGQGDKQSGQTARKFVRPD